MGYLTSANIGGSDYKLASGLYGTCDTADGTVLKTVTCPDFDALETGVTIHVKFSDKCSLGAAQLNVNSTGAKSVIGYNGTTSLARWAAGQVVSFTYDGSHWVMNDSYYDPGSDTKNTAGSTNATSKLYLIGAVTQAASAQTFSNSKVYATDGALVADSFNGYILADACAKGVDTSISASSTNGNVPTSLAVYNAIQSAVVGAAEYKGAITAESTLLNQALTKGWYYIVAMPDAQTSSITIGGKTCEAGDMVWIRDSGTYANSAALADHIDIIQANIDTLTNPEITTIWNNAVPVS